jgi:predicted HTH transcriptional regulator
MMRESMVNNGLSEPELQISDGGLFKVTLIGPGESLNGIKTTGHAWRIPEAKKAKLNERQRKIIKHLHKKGTVTSGWCREQFNVTYDTANRDLKGLMNLETIKRKGQGRSTYYVLAEEVGNGG